MADIEFNLLREPWIRVMRQDCRVEEVSLTDALLHAHEYKGLAGELPTQDAAVLRLLLAVLHAVFERSGIDGEESEIETADDAVDRWAELWDNGQFPEKPLTDYLDAQQDNFWLFHPTRPFWQIPDIPECASRPQSEPIQKLNGAVSESGHKLRLFAERSGIEKKSLTNAETARWLICMNQYDDNTLKTGLGVALLGQFLAIFAKGDTLFQTLMLNFVLVNQHGEPWEEIGKASWEQQINFDEAAKTIAYPNDPVAILSYHARYGKLTKKGEKLDCYKTPKGGICYEHISWNEQMAIWKHNKEKDEWFILKSLGGKPAWREFCAVINEGRKDSRLEDRKDSLLVQWHHDLIREGRIDKRKMLRYEFVEIAYDTTQHSSVENICSDSLSLHLNLLSDLGEVYRRRITDMVARCDKAAECIGHLAADLFLASGGDTEKKANPSKIVKEHYYYEIDVPFRKWLVSLDADDSPEVRKHKINDWCQQADAIAQRIAEQMVQDAGQPAFIGKMVSIGKDKKKYYSSSLAMKYFRLNMKNL